MKTCLCVYDGSYYNKAIELSPSYIRARYNLSISLIQLGKYLESVKNLFDSLIIQEEASSSSSLAFPPQNSSQSHGPLHRLSGNEQERSGVTSDVLWQTLEINCSLWVLRSLFPTSIHSDHSRTHSWRSLLSSIRLKNHFAHSQNELDYCFLNKDLDQLKLIFHQFL